MLIKNFFWGILAIISLELFARHFTYASGSQVTPVRRIGYWYSDADINSILGKLHTSEQHVTIAKATRSTYKSYALTELSNQLRQWQRDSNSHSTVVIPLNVGGDNPDASGIHWLAVILRNGNAYVLDSSNGNSYINEIEDFLKEFGITAPITIVKNVALQTDGSSCGAYTIENIMAFLHNKKARRDAQAMRDYHARIIESKEGEEWQVEAEEPNATLSLPSKPSSRPTENTAPEQINKPSKKSGDVQQQKQQPQALLQNQQEVINAVNNISIMLNTVMQPIINTRMAEVVAVNMKANDNNPKTVASGTKINDPHITPKSCDIWAKGCIGTIKQEATNNSETTAESNLYGITVGIDKLLNNNALFGVALSYAQFNTKHKTPQASTTKEQTDNHYQANIYMHYSPTNCFFLEMIGGWGVYGNNTKIQNIFSLSQDHIFGYHGCATVGYSFFPIERIALTPTLKLLYYHIYIPDSSFCNDKSSNFSTLGRLDSTIGIAIKLLEVNNNINGNFVVIPEGTVTLKFRLHDSVNGVYADQLKLPKAASTSYDDLSANVLAFPRQLLQLGLKLSLSTPNVSISLFGNIEIAPKYLAGIYGINLQLSF